MQSDRLELHWPAHYAAFGATDGIHRSAIGTLTALDVDYGRSQLTLNQGTPP